MRTNILIRCLIAASALALLPAQRVHAQGNTGMFGSAGPLSQGAGSRTSMGATSAMFGPTSIGGASGTQGSRNAQSSAFGNGQGQSGVGVTSAGQRNTFVGGSDNSQRFVGQSQAGRQQANQANLGGLRGGQGGQGGRGQNGANGNNPNQQNANGGGFGGSTPVSPQRVIRPQMKVAFSAPSPMPAKTTASINNRFQKLAVQIPRGSANRGISNRAELKGVTVQTPEAGEVVLKGTVATEDARRLAAIMARLEPGVRSVRNDITVEP
jgi:hypothetical protein